MLTTCYLKPFFWKPSKPYAVNRVAKLAPALVVGRAVLTVKSTGIDARTASALGKRTKRKDARLKVIARQPEQALEADSLDVLRERHV